MVMDKILLDGPIFLFIAQMDFENAVVDVSLLLAYSHVSIYFLQKCISSTKHGLNEKHRFYGHVQACHTKDSSPGGSMNCAFDTRNMLSLSMLVVDAFLQRAQLQVVSNKNVHYRADTGHSWHEKRGVTVTG